MITKWEYYAARGDYGPEAQKEAEGMAARRRGMLLLLSGALSAVMLAWLVAFAAMLTAS